MGLKLVFFVVNVRLWKHDAKYKKMKSRFVKFTKNLLSGQLNPSQEKNLFFFETFSLSTTLSLLTLDKTLSLSQFLHDFSHLRPSSSPTRATRWSSTFGLEDPTQNRRLSRSSNWKMSSVSCVLLTCSSLFWPPRRFNSPPPAWNHHEHPLAGPIHVCWHEYSFVRGSYDLRPGSTSYAFVAPRLDRRTSWLSSLSPTQAEPSLEGDQNVSSCPSHFQLKAPWKSSQLRPFLLQSKGTTSKLSSRATRRNLRKSILTTVALGMCC